MDTPSLDRRAFLAGGARVAAGAGALALTGCSTGDSGESTASGISTPTPTGDLRDWENVRAQFSLDPEVAHFSAFVLASHPATVKAAIERWRGALDADPARIAADETRNDETVRSAAARYLAVAREEIALTDSTTMGLGLIYNGLKLRPGDHILTTTHDFYSTHESLRLAAARSGARVQQVALYNDPATATAGQMVSFLREEIRRTTRVVALTWVHSSTGVKIPVREIADVLEDINADRDPADRVLLCLDAVHGFAAEETTPAGLGCDVFITGTHKWLFGPRGTGFVWARRDVWDRFTAIIPTFSGPSIGGWLFGERAPFQFGLDGTPGGFHSFEHRWALTDAFDFHSRIGKNRVAERTRELATRLKEGLAGLPNVRLLTPADEESSSGIVCCTVDGLEPPLVVETLRRDHGIMASVTPYRTQYVRFGTSIVTTPEQVDAAVAALADIP
jgi:selenocysteine lyase/cysteine desulfurase